MILRVILFPSTVSKLTKAEKEGMLHYKEQVHDVEAAKIAWTRIMTYGIFDPSTNEFIPPHRIAGAVVADE